MGGHSTLPRRLSVGLLAVLLVAGPSWAVYGGGGETETTVDESTLVGPDQLHDWQAEIDDFGNGNRPTGSPAEQAYIDHVATQLKEMGVQNVREDAFEFAHWKQPTSYGLELVDDNEGQTVDVASYIPYSGQTPADGVEAPLEYVGADTDPTTVSASTVQGKIVVIDVPPVPLRAGVFEAISYYEHDPEGTVNPWTPYERTWVSQIPMWSILDALSQAGAAGVVAVLDAPEEAAEGAYFPYDGVIRSAPGVYVDRSTGDMLKAKAQEGTRARLTLATSVDPESSSANLIGEIPGRTEDAIVLHSHLDGPNSIEDNGPVAALALADYFLQVPAEERNRTIQILLTSGHFAGEVGAHHFVETNPELVDRMAALISMEHLGAQEWLPGDDGYELTGLNEAGGFFVPENEHLVRESIDWTQEAGVNRQFVMRPFIPSQESEDARTYPGEGQVFHMAGIPTIQYITGPTYLLNADQPTTEEFTDYELMHRQVRGFAQMTLDLSEVPPTELDSTDPTAVGQPTTVAPGGP